MRITQTENDGTEPQGQASGPRPDVEYRLPDFTINGAASSPSIASSFNVGGESSSGFMASTDDRSAIVSTSQPHHVFSPFRPPLDAFGASEAPLSAHPNASGLPTFRPSQAPVLVSLGPAGNGSPSAENAATALLSPGPGPSTLEVDYVAAGGNFGYMEKSINSQMSESWTQHPNESSPTGSGLLQLAPKERCLSVGCLLPVHNEPPPSSSSASGAQ